MTKHNMTNNQLAQRLNLNRSTIKRYLDNTAKPTYLTLYEIKGIFNISADDLLFKDLSNEDEAPN